MTEYEKRDRFYMKLYIVATLHFAAAGNGYDEHWVSFAYLMGALVAWFIATGLAFGDWESKVRRAFARGK